MDGLEGAGATSPTCYAQYIGKPLTKVPDPFGTHDSFAAHNTQLLFLDRYGFRI